MSRIIYRDTDKVIEEDDAGNVVTTWTNPHAPGAILAAITATAETAHEDGAEWSQPLGGHDAYKLGITVTHNGKTWVNLTAWNMHEPGVSGWREVVAEDYPAWVQPAGAHDAYILGAKVAHNGRLWECTQVNAGVNSYEPGVWGWTDIGAAP